ncbi:type II secretion system protein GspL [Hahella sp. NBU794]|uniref:type II secretion system protein GspL n=1 Tax=Hahella sp. NBU794 TaxID=3422590 RepID=UPI003D6DCE89
MTIKLFVRPIPVTQAAATALEWALYSYTGERIGSGRADDAEELMQLVAQHDLQDVWVQYVLPASHFTFTVAHVAAKQARYVQQALPFAIEEAIAEDVESMHLVTGERIGKEEYPVLVIRRERMDRWFEAASALEFPLHGMYVDAQMCPGEEGALTVLFDGDEVLLFQPGLVCMRTHHENLLPYLEICARSRASSEDDEAPAWNIRVLTPEDQKESLGVLLAQIEHVDGAIVQMETFSVPSFDLLCESFFNTSHAANLCQGPYAIKESSGSSGIGKWWPVAAVAAGWFAIQVGLDLTQGFMYQKQADEYDQQMVKLYRSLYPNEKNVSSPKRQMEGKLRNASNTGGGGFLLLLGEAGYQLSVQPGKQNMGFNNLQFSNQRGELAVEVKAPSLDQLDRYKQALVQSGYQVDIGSAIKEPSGVRGKITIKGS